ncbi:DMT family transporter [Piscinibacter sakaiensis]|uniref:Putative membrane protein n=1 Tax=Piscinibacter sakaiensis TaxID=1547922 RepID=A0A0K8P0L9_PISS1|nr:DMT family transporter [Piscinibacter sakaiensis]GAP36168.1 putative membrane protein [Piscinibacter sakaiensis]
MSTSSPLRPPRATPAAARANLRGIGWMVLAMAAFALEDAFVKRAARELPIGQVLLAFGLGGMLVFALAPARGGGPLLHPAVLSRAMAVRAVFEVCGRLFFALAITLTPLSSATAILQATPVLVVLGASLFFGERVGALRWAAVGIGLLGVLVVLRPTAGDFSALSLLTLVALVGFAGRDLASRAVPATLGTRHLGFYGFAAVVVAGVAVAAWDGRPLVLPGAAAAGLLALAVLVGTAAYAALMKAMRTGDIASVTPFRYTRLVFGLALGVAAFGERVDAAMLAGCAVILCAGLLIAFDARRRAPRQPLR